MQFPPRLVEGYRAFVATRLPVERSRFQRLAQTGQQPETMIIGCCDSRVSPEVIFDAQPGELFVVRNVANLVPPYAPTGSTHGVSAAIEFAVRSLKVKHIVVLGHSRCGGIRAFVDGQNGAQTLDFIDKWMALIKPAAAAVAKRNANRVGDDLTELEQASILATLDNLLTFPWVRERAASKELQLIGAFFNVATGTLAVYEPQRGVFAPIAAESPAA
jgi:carbonic anhydrase